MSYPINPWKDFASYKFDDARYFKGRDESIAKFLRIVDSGTLSVLYASSGIGKTSFLQAGIEPYLEEKGYAPIHILFTDDDFVQETGLGTILISHIEDERRKHNDKNSDNQWIWVPLFDEQVDSFMNHLSENADSKQFNSEESNNHKGQDDVSLWWKLHANLLKDTNGKTLKPLFIFDQFEEVFVKAKTQKDKLQSLFTIFEELASNNLPQSVEAVLEIMASNGNFLDIDTHNNYKIIFSLRKEYLSDFDYWTNDRHSIAELQQNRMLLLPLSRTQAMKVIKEQPLNSKENECYTTLNNIAETIINVIDDTQRNEVEPFILSVLCSRLYERAISMGKAELNSDDMNTYSTNTIIREFYEQKILSIIPKHSHVARIEEELIDEDGKRCRIKIKRLKDIDFEERYKKALEDAHLVRIDSYNGEDYIELVHDRVADAIMERRKESTKKNRLIFARIASFISIILLFFITYWIQSLPTSNRIFPYQLKTENENGRYVNYTGDSISGTDIVAINCNSLKTIVIDSCYFATIKARGCNNLRIISISNYCKFVTFDLDNCPMLNPIQLPSSVSRISFANIPPNNLTFHTEKTGRYVWKDNILWDKQDTTIVYARYDASTNVTPPLNTGKNNFTYKLRTFDNKESDTITLTGYDKKSKITDSLRIPRNIEFLDLHALNTNYSLDWDMSKFPNLCEIILPDSLIEISSYTFARCSNLRHVIFPPSLQRIGTGAFRDCLSLQEVILPDSINQIDSIAFENCTALTEICIPDSIQIHLSSFDKCSNLKIVRLPHFFRPKCYHYPDFMFKYCPNISKFYIDNSSNLYTVENDSTIVYSHLVFNYRRIPLFFFNTVRNHSYNSKEFIVADSFPPYSFYSKDGVLSYGNENGSMVINDPKNNIYLGTYIVNVQKGEEIVNIPITVNDVFLTGSLESCKELHFPYSDESKRKTIDLPIELKRNIRLYVPYGALSFFSGIDNFNVNEWKSIDEESFISWLYIICSYHFNSGLKFVGQWGWFWPTIIIAVLLIASLITYLYRRKEVGSKTNGSNIMRFFVNFTMTIVIGVFTWYTFYWLIFLSAIRFVTITNVISTLLFFLSATVATFLATIFVYVVLYSNGFNIKGFLAAFRRNSNALWSGIVDLSYALSHLSWQSVKQYFEKSIKRIKHIIRHAFKEILYRIKRFRHITIEVFQWIEVIPKKTKVSICLSFIVIIVLSLVFFVNGYDKKDQLGDDINTYCKKIIDKGVVTHEQIDSLHDKLVESVSIPGMKTFYSSTGFDIKALGDSIFIVTESDSCYYLNFSSMRHGYINFGESIRNVKWGNFYLSDSQKFIYYKLNDSVYIWKKNSLQEKPFKERMKSSYSKCTWFAQDKYVCFENDEGNFVIYSTKDWSCLATVEERNSYIQSEKISDGVLVTIYTYADEKSEAYLYDENLKLHHYYFEGKYKGCLDNNLVSQKGDMYILYDIKEGLSLDMKFSNIEYDFESGHSYASKYQYYSDSIYIFKVVDKQIVFDIIPYQKKEISNKYVSFKNNDSIMIYHIPTNQTYNLGYSKGCSYRDSLVAINANGVISVYFIADSVKLLGQIPYNRYSIYMDNSNNYLTFSDSKGLFCYNADSLWQTNILTNDVHFYGWYCHNDNNYYSLEHFDEGPWFVASEIKRNIILRGGWCFMASRKGYELNNIKSIKLLIKESLYIDNELKEELCSIIDRYEDNNE